jgi:TATA-binding protein-associated factor
MELLPIVMRSITDTVEECSRIASSSFAILVRIAPLAVGYIDRQCDDQTSSVVRHLILGKPLPPCDVPDIILTHLRMSGTTLRPYQMEGVAWLRFLADVHLNGALCDDMGLGKTLVSLIAIAISHHNKSGEDKNYSSNSRSGKKSLVVCPASVVGHWMNEIKRFFPSDQVFTPFNFTGSAKARRELWYERLHQSNIVVTSYSVLRTDVDKLEDVLWEWCVLDEGHLLRNPKTCRYSLFVIFPGNWQRKIIHLNVCMTQLLPKPLGA